MRDTLLQKLGSDFWSETLECFWTLQGLGFWVEGYSEGKA